MRRVGYWMSEKKNRRLNFEDHREVFRINGIDLVKIDIDSPLETQGPFDLILHKCTGLMVNAQEGDVLATKQINNIKDYMKKHPECILVDSFESIKKLIDRNEQYKLLLKCHLLDSDSYVFTPTFVELTTTDVETNKQRLKDANVSYPFVCKPTVAHGTSLSHQMAIIFDESGLKDVQPPCVAQTFLNHNAVLFKVFVIGNKHFIVERPSIKNFSTREDAESLAQNEQAPVSESAADQPTIFFDSSNVSKPNCTNFLTELDAVDLDRTPVNPDHEQLKHLGRIISEELKMELFGIDVIIDCDTKKYAVIDINAFPGYEGVDNFIELICDLLNSLMDQNQQRNSNSGCQEQYRKENKRSRTEEEGVDSKKECRKKLKLSEKGCNEKNVCQRVTKGDKNGNLRNSEAIYECQGYNSDNGTSDEDQDACDLIQWEQPINGCVEQK